MKNTIFIFALMIFLTIPIIGSYTKGRGDTLYLNRKSIVSKEVSYTLETLTIYNPTTKQCDKTPLITASNVKIDTDKLLSQQTRWIALSRNLLRRWNGQFNYGDTVKLIAGDQDIDGLWIIQDTLNKRYKDRGDLLFDSRVRTLGKWNNVKISKFVKL